MILLWIAWYATKKASAALEESIWYSTYYLPGSLGYAKGQLWFQVSEIWRGIATESRIE